MIHYVAGFAFTYQRQRVYLIRKERGPKNIVGRWNAIGGKVEALETLQEAQSREFFEEAGLSVDPTHWEHCVTLRGPDWKVTFFTVDLTEADSKHVRTMTDELVLSISVKDALEGFPLPSNLYWLLPLCRDQSVRFPVYVEEQ